LSGTGASVAEEQRESFRQAYEKARAGDEHVLRNFQGKLADYVLWPDLISANYLGRLSRMAGQDIEAHLARYPNTSLNRTLRHRYATRLAKRGATADYLRIYAANYRDAGDVTLDCYAAHARLHQDNSAANRRAALDLWLVGNSQPDECDPLFHRLDKEGLLNTKRYTERLHLALAQGNTRLAKYLAKKAPASEQAWVARWQSARENPARALERIDRVPAHALRDELYIYGVRRAARDDARAAHALLTRTAERAQISPAQYQDLLDYVALRGAREGLAEVDNWLDEARAPSDELARWRVRSALSAGDWRRTLTNIERMSDELQTQSPWRYFRARALAELGDGEAAQRLYAELAQERSYYGFMAADRLDQEYSFRHETIADDPQQVEKLMLNRDFVRARELFFVGLFGPARSEWARVVRDLDLPMRQQAALLADGWGWHSQAIRTLANSAGQNDLLRSYPTPFKSDYDENATKADIERTWAYSVTRAESLFMSDVRSSAGAIGLMQLIPGTGKETARRARVPYRGLQTLLDPQSNIQLGVHYLGQMYQRFDRNQVLATAAYNAGPRRVRSWLPQHNEVPADVWIETIPFTETRRYVKKVLFADTVFYWRLTGDERRLASRMPPISHTP
jgi:soluble lytic murein transglycosylase